MILFLKPEKKINGEKKKKSPDRSRWPLILENGRSSRILDNRWFMKNTDKKEDEKYKVFDTTKWFRSKTKHALIPIDRSQL